MKNRQRLRFNGTLSALSLASLFVASAASAEVAVRDEPRPPGITLQSTVNGVVYADKKGMTIYTANFDNKPGESNCTNDARLRDVEGHGDRYSLPNMDHRPTCLGQTPLVAADAGSKPVGAWTIIDRPDGLKQWAYGGRPLYTSVKDIHPGDTNLARLGNDRGYHKPVLAPVILPPEVLIGRITAARILTTAEKKLTLYTSAADTDGKSHCEGACATQWHPVLAPEVAKEQGGWTAPRRADGTRQWTLNGKPLYTHARDVFEGDYKGNSQPGWDVALLSGLPPTPDAMKVVYTYTGPKFADSRGMTLYIWHCTESSTIEPSGKTACDTPDQRSIWWTSTCGSEAMCADTWRPVLAAEGAKGDGKIWSVVTLQNPWAPVRAAEGQPGVKAWAYQGVPVFTFKFEDRPGMMEGDLIGVQSAGEWNSIDADGYDINQSPKEARAASR